MLMTVYVDENDNGCTMLLWVQVTMLRKRFQGIAFLVLLVVSLVIASEESLKDDEEEPPQCSATSEKEIPSKKKDDGEVDDDGHDDGDHYDEDDDDDLPPQEEPPCVPPLVEEPTEEEPPKQNSTDESVDDVADTSALAGTWIKSNIILSHYIYFCFYVSIVLRFIFKYSTVTGRKCEINIIVIVIVKSNQSLLPKL